MLLCTDLANLAIEHVVGQRERWGGSVILDKFLENLSVTVRPFALCEVSTGWRLKMPVPPGTILHFVLKGSGRVGVSRLEARRLEPGYMVVVPAGSYNALETGDHIIDEVQINDAPSDPGIHRIVAGPAKGRELVVACGLLDVRYGQTIDLFHGLNQTLVVDLSMVPQVRNAMNQIFAEQYDPVPGSAAMTNALMLQILLHVFRSLPSEGGRAMAWLIALQDARLARAIDNILDDPSANHTVLSLSDAAAMSRSAFSELFGRSFGRPPMGFVHRIRMQRASELLSGTSFSTDEIAARVGFASRSHFAQSFKKHTGLSPHAFRESALNRIAPMVIGRAFR
jgi:AraC-like DNA-binding protein